jgi:hypothetical protein
MPHHSPHTDVMLRSSTQVSLKAREVLILVQMPSFDERFVQMESILKAAVASSFGGHAGERYVGWYTSGITFSPYILEPRTWRFSRS